MRIVAVLYGGRCDGEILDIVGTEQKLHVLNRVLHGTSDELSSEDVGLIDTVYLWTGRHRIVEDMDQREYVSEDWAKVCPYCGQPINGHTHAAGDIL